MKAVFISDDGSRFYKIKINIWAIVLLFAFVLILLGFIINRVSVYHSNHSISKSDRLIINRFDSYLKRLSTLEAQTQRLNELGARIAKKNHINIDTFLLDKEPARGGIIDRQSNSMNVLSEQNLISSINSAEQSLASQERKFYYYMRYYNDLKTVATNKKLLASSHLFAPEYAYTSPVNKGYISSKYGYRRDPINGRHRFHRGIDIAGKTGTPISAIANGFVSFTGRKGGYGNVVEINHSDSLKSRYAHLKSILVKKGQVVRKGDTIAKMGSTGRVTGPHLHLEVWKNGKVVNPIVYLQDALKSLKL